MALDRGVILDSALGLVDELGLDGFTMRKLGERLGTSQMATYRHFPDKQAIIDALADQLVDQMRLPEEEVGQTDPEQRIMGFLTRTREILLAHPPLVPIVAARSFDQMPGSGEVPQVFEAAGFPQEFAVGAALTVATTALGLVLYETQHRALAADPDGANTAADIFRGHAMAPLLEWSRQVSGGPPIDDNLLTRAKAGNWQEAVYEITIRECYAGLKRRLGTP